ncbi:hypothetical protein ABH930_005819, partial [Kitasatospora sp. GAS204A]
MSPAPGGPAAPFLINPGGWWSQSAQLLWSLAVRNWPALGTMLVGGATLRWSVRWWVHRSRQRRLTAEGTTLVILAPPTVEPRAAEVLWGHLVGLLRPWWQRLAGGQPHIAFEYRFTSAGLTIRLWAPGVIPSSLLRRAVESAWPGTHTKLERPAPELGKDHPFVTGGTLRLARPEILPLKTEHGADPLRALLGAGLGLAAGDEVTVSVLARPATGARIRRAKHQLRQLGTSSGASGPGRPAHLFDLLTHQPSRATPAGRDPEQSSELRAALAKAAGPQWEAAIRYSVTIPTEGTGEAAVAAARARGRSRAHAVASAFAVYSGRNWYARHRLRHPAETMTARHFPRHGDLLSVPELAALAHLPTDPAAPGVQRAGARSVPPVPAIPLPGPSVKPLGTADTGPARPIGLAIADARHHLHIVGATGSGKSTLMATMILDDARAGRGTVVIDPKGDLIHELLTRLPESALGRTVLIDPDDHALPPRLNVLEGPDADVVVDNLAGIFRRIFAAFWGPRTDDVMRAACLTSTSWKDRMPTSWSTIWPGSSAGSSPPSGDRA